MSARPSFARAALLCALVVAVLPIAVAGLRGAVLLLAVGAGGVVVTVAALYWALTRRGVLRAAAAGVAVAAPIVVVVMYVRAHLLWVVLLAAGFAVLALLAARAALRPPHSPVLEHLAPEVEHPFLIMNPRSGGGKVVAFDLPRRAAELGAEVALLDGPEPIDVVALAREAVARGADLLGVAGGDGTQALVAGVAAEHGLPFLVISAGTRNHFAMDLGLDRADPVAGLTALTDGIELHVDLARINGRPFVNNASFGVYAQIVEDPAYRDDKARTVLARLPDLLTGPDSTLLIAHADETRIVAPQAILVSNNPYGSSDLAGLSHRERLDRGVLGVAAVAVASTGAAIGLLRRTRTDGLTRLDATTVTVDAATPRIPVGVDGESLLLDTPVRCTIEPGALRVRVPATRPGVRAAAPTVDWVRLLQLAGPAG
ncbi:diacylglycerol/lipid kinase family protein [Nocardia asteroides]|uniref:diacylglycerol/lipid kinase family protein n=1 Tax=Nocardia asteroides TaxID=1824 RepID=UPI001E4466D2|nr:diacylglycerol kinase family protein [Nocardia asteroides]UGT62484.1 diacylglycerol kinase [Nocardia asteroides]